MDYLEYKGYKGSAEYSKEDNYLFGKVQGISKVLILYEGQTLDELRKDFEEGIDSYIEGRKADNKEFSEKLKAGIELAGKRMLEEKALRGEDLIVSYDGKTIKRIPAKQLL